MSDEPLPQSGIIPYQTEEGRTRIQCRFENETLWLTQVQIAELFQTSVPNINLHLKAIYAENELAEGATIKSYLIVRSEGGRQVSRPVLHYNLPAILAVGFRVRSHRGRQFRQWATARLSPGAYQFRRGPRSRPLRVGPHCCRQCSCRGGQKSLVQVDQDTGRGVRRIRVAGRLWCVCGFRIQRARRP